MRPMARRLLTLATVLLVVGLVVIFVATPFVRAASLIVRAANLGGRAEAFANDHARTVVAEPKHMVDTRYGQVPARFYVPSGDVNRAVLLIPGIHSMGIEEPRLTALAQDLAGTGVTVMTMALPDLQAYTITPRATDVIEDAVSWMARRNNLAPDGRVGIVGISFAGGLSISAAGRPSIRDKVAFILSFGGHGDLPRVMRYLATGEAPKVAGVATHPPHDYGVAVILYGLADNGVVPSDQVGPLRDGIRTFLLASQLTLVNMDQANATFAHAREMAKALPEPARTFMNYVNDRAVGKLGPALVPFLEKLGSDDPALSPQRAADPPAAPVYLLHGDDDTVIPAAESALLNEYLKSKGVSVHLLLSNLITHAEVNRSATASDTWKLVAFWASVLRQ
jgi:dienelactone hydrolase